MNETYIDIKRIAEIKGLKSTRSIRIAIQKGKYIAREVKVNGGTSYEILYSSMLLQYLLLQEHSFLHFVI